MSGNVTVLDSNLYSPIFSNNAMRKIMSDEAYTARLIEAEVALARVEGKLGVIPKDAADDIEKLATPDKIDIERLRRDTELVGLPIWGLSRQLTEACGDSGRFIHWGANTHDIMDLAVVLQMKDALNLLERQINDVRATLVALARRHRNTIMVARTHLQQALPTTFGYKAAVWLYALDRHCERLQQLRPRVLMAQMAGASGSLASLKLSEKINQGTSTKAEGLDVLKALAEDLDLVEPPIAWHAVRDGIAEVVSFLAMVGGSLGKIAYDVILMSMTEVGEVAEPFVPHRGASSTMPQKQNPMSSETVLAISKILRSHTSLALDAIVTDFERASGPWHLEWVVIPECFTYCSAALEHTAFILHGLQVRPKAMKHNLDLSRGLPLAEHIMVALAPHFGRSTAHDIVYESCRICIDSGASLRDVLKENSLVMACMSEMDLDWYCDPNNYLGQTVEMIDRVLKDRTADL